MKAVCDLLARFQKLTVLNLTKLGPWVAEICISLKIMLSYCLVKEKNYYKGRKCSNIFLEIQISKLK